MKKFDDRSAWDKAWEDKFARAEQEPPAHLWSGIEARLANAESDRYKKRLLFYQWVAAAAVLFAVATTAVWINYTNPMQDTAGALARQEVTTSAEEAQIADAGEAGGHLAAVTEEPRSARVAARQKASPRTENNQPAITQEEVTGATLAATSANNNQTDEASTGEARNSATPTSLRMASVYSMPSPDDTPAQSQTLGLLAANKESAAGPMNQAERQLGNKSFIAFTFDPVAAEPEKVWMLRKPASRKEKTDDDNRFWLGTSVAATSFDPKFQEQPSSTAAFAPDFNVSKGEASLAQTDSWQDDESAEPSVNLSVQGGLRLNNRWSLQAGVQYGAYRVNSQAGTFIDVNNSQAYPLHYSNFSPERVQRVRANSRLATPVEITSSFEMVSLPLRVGYTVIDGRFNMTLSPGISSEIFLSNQLYSENSLVSSYTVRGGSESPYRSLYFSGILGAQFSYQLGDHYLFTLEPSYRQAITDFNKSDAVFKSRPSSLGVGVGIRYVIR